VDIAPSTGLIDLERIEEKITAKTKAIIPVHYYGQMVDMIRLAKIAKKHGIVIIEDAAHALEAVRDGNRPGALSFAAAFSFHAAKNMTAGQGGALVSNDTTVTEFTNAFCDSGIRRIDGARRSVMLGYKYPITSFQVALLEGQLTRLAANHKKRLAVFARYRAGLSKVTGITLIEDVPGSVHACHLFNVLVDPACRDAIRKDLSAAGIDTAVFHEVIHLEPYFKDRFGYKAGDFPHAERFAASLIGLPTYPGLTAREQSYIIKHLTEQLV
jgi:dTDP-4-amino-4,6-dideoxygalactose transaminase